MLKFPAIGFAVTGEVNNLEEKFNSSVNLGLIIRDKVQVSEKELV